MYIHLHEYFANHDIIIVSEDSAEYDGDAILLSRHIPGEGRKKEVTCLVRMRWRGALHGLSVAIVNDGSRLLLAISLQLKVLLEH